MRADGAVESTTPPRRRVRNNRYRLRGVLHDNHAEARCHLRDQPHEHRHALCEHATFGDEACSGETDPEAKALLAEFTLTPSSRVYQHHRPEAVLHPSTSGSGERRGNRLILPQSV
jgi:hypothetical protein